MIFPVETVLLKDGRACTLRPAAPEDAEAMLRFLSEVSEETAYLLRCADEWTYTREDEEGLLCSILESGKRMMMLAEIDGVIAGNCALNGADKPRRTAHRASLAIAIRRAYWGLGLGTAMIERACRLAPRMGYAQVELGVVEGNERALSLYGKAGFMQTGRTPNAFRYDDGTLRDEIQMVRTL
ncbi:MAG: GNAT family N-acetyltransferase [Clostridiales bacterium]|nr:GNAT family N-acetyltransferase [Clostridiales bacterium]